MLLRLDRKSSKVTTKFLTVASSRRSPYPSSQLCVPLKSRQKQIQQTNRNITTDKQQQQQTKIYIRRTRDNRATMMIKKSYIPIITMKGRQEVAPSAWSNLGTVAHVDNREMNLHFRAHVFCMAGMTCTIQQDQNSPCKMALSYMSCVCSLMDYITATFIMGIVSKKFSKYITAIHLT
jgi:hypothetical protein